MMAHWSYSSEHRSPYQSHYELGRREPTLPIILEYARAANVFVDVLIDDSLELPERLPSRKKSEGIVKSSLTKRRK